MMRFLSVILLLLIAPFAGLAQGSGEEVTDVNAGSFKVRKSTVIDVTTNADSLKPEGWAPFSAADFGYAEPTPEEDKEKEGVQAEQLSPGLYCVVEPNSDQPVKQDGGYEYMFLNQQGSAYYFSAQQSPEEVNEILVTNPKKLQMVTGNWWKKPPVNPEYVVRFRTGEPGASFSVLFEGKFIKGSFVATKENSVDDSKTELQFKLFQ